MGKFLKSVFSKETLLYIAYGIGTSVVDFVAFTVLVYLGMGSITSNNIAWCAAVLFAFVTNKLFVFKSTSWSPAYAFKEFVMFVAGRVFTLVGTDVILKAADILHKDVLAAKILAMALTVVANYIFSKLIIFRKADNCNVGSQEE